MSSAPEPPRRAGCAGLSLRDCLLRMERESEFLARSAIELQAALAELPLADYPQETRTALQSVDRIAQSLHSLGHLHGALARSSDPITPAEVISSIDSVPMASLRARLLAGCGGSTTPAEPPGTVDLF